MQMTYNAHMATIPPVEARDYLRRWEEVRRAQQVLDRQQSFETRLQQLSTLMFSRELFRADPLREAETEQLRQRWLHIRAAFGG